MSNYNDEFIRKVIAARRADGQERMTIRIDDLERLVDAIVNYRIEIDTMKKVRPIAMDAHGVARFKKNAIVSKVYDVALAAGYGMNEISVDKFKVEDRREFAQMLGYSVYGYGDLSYAGEEFRLADSIVCTMEDEKGAAA